MLKYSLELGEVLILKREIVILKREIQIVSACRVNTVSLKIAPALQVWSLKEKCEEILPSCPFLACHCTTQNYVCSVLRTLDLLHNIKDKRQRKNVTQNYYMSNIILWWARKSCKAQGWSRVPSPRSSVTQSEWHRFRVGFVPPQWDPHRTVRSFSHMWRLLWPIHYSVPDSKVASTHSARPSHLDKTFPPPPCVLETSFSGPQDFKFFVFHNTDTFCLPSPSSFLYPL